MGPNGGAKLGSVIYNNVFMTYKSEEDLLYLLFHFGSPIKEYKEHMSSLAEIVSEVIETNQDILL